MIDAQLVAEALDESAGAFRKQFDRSDPDFHGGSGFPWVETPVPLGGGRVPTGMLPGLDSDVKDWRDLPEVAVQSIEPQYPPEYHQAMAVYDQLNKLKKAMSVLNKPVEMAMKVRCQYKEAKEVEDDVALKSRLQGEETKRDGALESVKLIFAEVSSTEFVTDRSRSTVSEVLERGAFAFEDKETFGEYMTTLQRCNQAIFADQKKLLQKIKDLKKAQFQMQMQMAAKTVSEPSAAAPLSPATAGA
jgi:hypothetical protein